MGLCRPAAGVVLPFVIALGLGPLACAQDTFTSGPWSWQETPSGLRLNLDDQPLISLELVQLVDTSSGWKPVYANGGKDSRPAVGPLADGRVGSRSTLTGPLAFERETWVEQDRLQIAVTCEVLDPGPATRFFYSLEIPAVALADGAWRADVEGVPCGAEIAAAGGSAIVEPVERLEVISQRGLLDLQGSAEGAAWSFQDWRRPPHDAFRLRIELPAKAGLRFAARLSLGRTEPAPSVADFLSEARQRARALLDLSHQEPLAARGLTCLTPRPAVGAACELLADIGCTYEDPFDPSDVDVVARIVTPSREYSLPAYYYQPFAREQAEGRDEVTAGAAEWRLRFLPTEAGEHRVSLRVRDRTGTAECGPVSGPVSVPVAAADWPGVLRVSARNPLALARGGDEPFFCLGVNIFDRTDLGRPLPPGRIDRSAGYIESLAAAGGNFIRLRMDSWWFAIDNPPSPGSGYLGPGRFNQRACWDVDRLLDLCERLGVQVMLCLENANATVNSPGEAWREAYNTYSAANGGPCETMADFWTDEAARDLMRRKIRYCVARWSARPALGLWEFFNEAVLGGKVEPGPIVAWHDEMAREFKRLDPYGHLVTTSPMGERDPEASKALWAVGALDVAQVHDYSRMNTADVYHTAQEGATAFGKPFIVGEFGFQGAEVRAGGFSYAQDAQGLVAHLGHWAGALSLGAAAPLDWYVNYLDAQGLWGDFTRLAAFLADLPRDDPALGPLHVAAVAVEPGGPLAEPRDATIAPEPSWEKSPHTRYVVKDDGSPSPEKGLNGILWGTVNHADLREPPTFVANYPRVGRFVAHVMEVVGRGSNPVRLTLDGRVALEEDLVCEEGKVERWEARQPGPTGNLALMYDRDLAIDVPAGEHEISVENLGRDRLTVLYRLEGYRTREHTPGVMAVGLVHGRGVHLWIANRTWTPEVLLGTVETIAARGVRVTVEGLRDGKAEVEWWEPMTGEKLRTEPAEIRDGRLVLAVGDLARDIACKVRYAGE